MKQLIYTLSRASSSSAAICLSRNKYLARRRSVIVKKETQQTVPRDLFSEHCISFNRILFIRASRMYHENCIDFRYTDKLQQAKSTVWLLSPLRQLLDSAVNGTFMGDVFMRLVEGIAETVGTTLGKLKKRMRRVKLNFIQENMFPTEPRKRISNLPTWFNLYLKNSRTKWLPLLHRLLTNPSSYDFSSRLCRIKQLYP